MVDDYIGDKFTVRAVEQVKRVEAQSESVKT